VFTVGFAAETGDLERNARDKLARKSLDMIAANDVGGAGIGFESEDNELHVFWRSGGVKLVRAPKSRIARQLIELIATRFREREVGAVTGAGVKATAPVGTGAG